MRYYIVYSFLIKCKTHSAMLLFVLIYSLYFLCLGGSVPAELGEMDGRNAAAATVGLVNGEKFCLIFCLKHINRNYFG